MKVSELLDLFTKIQGFGEAEVLAFDPDKDQLVPITGVIYGTDEDGSGYFCVTTEEVQ